MTRKFMTAARSNSLFSVNLSPSRNLKPIIVGYIIKKVVTRIYFLRKAVSAKSPTEKPRNRAAGITVSRFLLGNWNTRLSICSSPLNNRILYPRGYFSYDTTIPLNSKAVKGIRRDMMRCDEVSLYGPL